MTTDPVTLLIEKAIYGSSLRHKAIAGNISNVNTPDYKRIDVDFKTSLKNAAKNLETGNKSEAEKQLANYSPEILNDTSSSVRIDGNNVDIDVEMTALAENTLEYNIYATLMAKKLDALKTVINEGRK
jgi:flagellar basal-body rod protein FlgB